MYKKHGNIILRGDNVSKIYIAKTLKAYRERRGIDVKEVAQKFNKSVKTIYAWENGQGQPDADTLIELCKWYNIKSFHELSEESYDPPIVDKAIEVYSTLNTLGKKKATSYILDIASLDKYTKPDSEPISPTKNESPHKVDLRALSELVKDDNPILAAAPDKYPEKDKK